MANIYTKTGDKGQTGLYGGSRVEKDSPKVECYGTLDEAISMLGLAYTETEAPKIKEYINHIQKRMFQAGAEVASDEHGLEILKDKITEADIKYLEDIIDECTEVCGPQREFVVPGVNKSSSALHVARTIVRRAERHLVALAKEAPVREVLRKFVNRLSDACYAMARLEETCMQNKELEALVKKVVKEALDSDECTKTLDMSLESLKKMAEYAEEKANEIKVPVVFSAVDAGGNLLLLHRMEDALLASIKISWDKAYTACTLKAPTCALADLTVPGGGLYGLQNLCDGRLVVFGGGYPIMKDGKVIGAIGVSGGTAEEDMAVATYAIEKMQGGKA
ncbi:MAG: cob(I)yrinic acid a,c-diamide adenosyltransferase [Lachnospiraceae bacterium]|nr:cob(I)yrinic acid a,c-diamide adenosyltransferase [Lachnospiraceae bacterium]